MPRIPIPPEMPLKYRRQYMSNWKAVLYKTEFPYPDFTGTCVGCGLKGIIGSRNLTHRGDPTPTNLLCLSCYKDGDDIDEQKTDQATAGQRKKKGSRKELVRRKPPLVRESTVLRRSRH